MVNRSLTECSGYHQEHQQLQTGISNTLVVTALTDTVSRPDQQTFRMQRKKGESTTEKSVANDALLCGMFLAVNVAKHDLHQWRFTAKPRRYDKRLSGTNLIHEVSGNMTLSGAHAIAHGIAANDPMNQGLAKTPHEAHPAMHKDFHHYCHTQHRKEGDAWLWGGSGDVRVINLITQSGGYEHGSKPGNASNKAVNNCLRSLIKLAQKEQLTSIALPRLGCPVGRLEFDEVKQIVSNRLGDADLPVYFYADYVPRKKAKEPGLQ